MRITVEPNTWFVGISQSLPWAGELSRTTHNQSKTFRWTQTCFEMNENTLTSRDSIFFINNVWNNELLSGLLVLPIRIVYTSPWRRKHLLFQSS